MEGGEGLRHSAYARIFSEHANERTGKIREDPNRDDANNSFFFKNRSFGSVSSLMTIVGTSYTGEREREENH